MGDQRRAGRRQADTLVAGGSLHHIATAIQLPAVIASIAHELGRAIDAETAPAPGRGSLVAGLPLDRAALVNGASAEVLLARLDRSGRVVTAPTSGYLRLIRHATLVRIAAEYDAVIRLHYRPGHLSARTVPEPADQADMAARHEALLALHERVAHCRPGGSTA